jgi:hypothetical protein
MVCIHENRSFQALINRSLMGHKQTRAMEGTALLCPYDISGFSKKTYFVFRVNA